MMRTVLRAPALRSVLVAAGSALLVGVLSVPARAATAPPAAPTAAVASIGAYLLDLSWSGGGGTGAVVRDVTGLAAPYALTTGREVPTQSGTSARDTQFTNVGTARYAIWSTESDGTPSDAPLLQDVPATAPVATSLSLGLSGVELPYGQPFAVTGTLTRAGGVPVANQPVDLYARNGGAAATVLVRRVRTGADGTLRTTVLPRFSVALTLRFAGDAFSGPSASPVVTAQVLPRLSARLVPPAIVRQESTLLTGRALPAYGAARVVVQRGVGPRWRTIGAARTASNGTYRFPLSPELGVYRYRAVLTATAGWDRAVSPAVTLRVDARDLVSGMQGDDVLALQSRLAGLHYDVGAADGMFGYDLTHAVMAFQKVERLPVTGQWTRAERVRAGHPTAWALRRTSTGTAVEIDLTRQVLVLSRAGAVQRIVDVSTGNEHVYYQDGERNIAHTPRGQFAVTWRYDGTRTSKLGLLYRPAYWFEGYAIHGSASVPASPASHGCIRVTNPVMDRLFPILVAGVPVSLYDE